MILNDLLILAEQNEGFFKRLERFEMKLYCEYWNLRFIIKNNKRVALKTVTFTNEHYVDVTN